MAFVDEVTIKAKAGDGGHGVIRWLRNKETAKGGPSGGDGGRGGDVVLMGVRDLAVLANYKYEKDFAAEHGEAGGNELQHGKNGKDVVLKVPVGTGAKVLATGELVEVSGECLLAFDVDGVIVGANTGARRLLGARGQDQTVHPLVGSTLPRIFKVDMAEIWHMSRTGTTSERTVLSTRLHELFYAMVSPPRHFGSKLIRGLAAASVPADCPALDNLAGEDGQMQRLVDQAKRLVLKITY